MLFELLGGIKLASKYWHGKLCTSITVDMCTRVLEYVIFIVDRYYRRYLRCRNTWLCKCVRPSVRLSVWCLFVCCFFYRFYSPGANKALRFVTTSGLARTHNNPELPAVRRRYASDLNKGVAFRNMCMFVLRNKWPFAIFAFSCSHRWKLVNSLVRFHFRNICLHNGERSDNDFLSVVLLGKNK